MVKTLSRFALRFGLIPIAYGILRLYFLSVRVRSVGEEGFRAHLQQGGGAIAAIWHQRFMNVVTYARRFSDYRPAVMISRSRDGEMIADVCRLLKFRPVRGSSSQGGREALAAVIADLSLHPIAIHAVDGPQGPRGVVKAGIIRMAQLSGVPIVPVYISVDRAWVLRSWDRFLIPKPFSTVVVRWGEPIPVPAVLDEARFEDLRREVEALIRANQEEDDRQQGWKSSLF
jgi:hypothetical protein